MWIGSALETIRAWLREWAQRYLWPSLKVQLKILATGVLNGVMDVVLLVSGLVAAVTGSTAYMDQQYTLPRQAQQQVIAWVAVSDRIARDADIPSVAPLVLWYKEAGLAAVNPDNCEGIMGLHDLIVSRKHSCFAPGPIDAAEIAEQLQIGAREFKARCPRVHYSTTDPALIKYCYLTYNAGARTRLALNGSAYVMNGYDSAHRNMIHRDSRGRTYPVQSLGAWPAHLAVESLILNLVDSPEGARLSRPAVEVVLQPLLDTLIRLRDYVADWPDEASAPGRPAYGTWRAPRVSDCLVSPYTGGDPDLRPILNPVVKAPVITQDLHGCSYGLPGLDISSKADLASPLQAPMPGVVTTFTDQWQNTTIRIENSEWIVVMLHPRSYRVRQGQVVRGQLVGVMGAQGRASGPHVHFSIYDKISRGYVDAGAFIPALSKSD